MGNIFFNVNKEAARDSSFNPITTGADGARNFELISRNILAWAPSPPPARPSAGNRLSPNRATSATLVVAGPGIWSYRWRLNGGPRSAEVSLVPQAIWNGAALTPTMFDDAPPIVLCNLPDASAAERSGPTMHPAAVRGRITLTARASPPPPGRTAGPSTPRRPS